MESNSKQNVAVVEHFINEVINKQNFGLLDALWSKDMQWHGGSLGDVNGLENYKEMLFAAARGSFSDMHLHVKEVIASGDRVVVYFTNSGKNVGDFMGHKATNKNAKWDGMGIYRIESGKIAEAWFSEDLLSMFFQLGFLTN